MAQRLAESLVVVVAGDRHDRTPAHQEGSERIAQVFDGIPQAIGAGGFAEHIAGDDQHIDRLRPAIRGDSLDGATKIVGAIDSA
jgi:hypothetical protein